jgi:signal transduction histidine kinase
VVTLAIEYNQPPLDGSDLPRHDAVLTLEVRDDGRGFDPASRKAMPLGLAGMEERALALGGRLEIRSAPGEGTTVTLRCPVELPTAGVTEPGGSSPTRSSSRPLEATRPRAAARD